MSHWGENITKELHPGSKERTLTVYYQEDQGGYPFVRVQYLEWQQDNTGSPDYYKVERNHYLSAQEAREMAAELTKAANKIDNLPG